MEASTRRRLFFLNTKSSLILRAAVCKFRTRFYTAQGYFGALVISHIALRRGSGSWRTFSSTLLGLLLQIGKGGLKIVNGRGLGKAGGRYPGFLLHRFLHRANNDGTGLFQGRVSS